jgi:hypothetical protein
MSKAFDIKRFRLYLYVGIAYIILGVLSSHSVPYTSFFPRVINNMWLTAPLVIMNYLFFEFWWPAIVEKKNNIAAQIILGILSVALAIFVYTFGLYLWRKLGVSINIFDSPRVYKNRYVLLEALCSYGVGSIVFTGLTRHIYNYTRLKRSEQRLRIEKQEAELSYLRSQTNPHFLFNTLNNIYSLSRDKSDLAPESILRLSKILRFMLYETSGDYIPIENEIRIIGDYIELEKLRYDESLRVNFNYNIEDLKQAIPPLILVPLVENAFKHGVSETRGEPFVEIHLSVSNRKLQFVVKNSFESSSTEPIRENIGLSNLRRQLELLYKDHSLTAIPGAGVFISTLNIDLSTHA